MSTTELYKNDANGILILETSPNEISVELSKKTNETYAPHFPNYDGKISETGPESLTWVFPKTEKSEKLLSQITATDIPSMYKMDKPKDVGGMTFSGGLNSQLPKTPSTQVSPVTQSTTFPAPSSNPSLAEAFSSVGMTSAPTKTSNPTIVQTPSGDFNPTAVTNSYKPTVKNVKTVLAEGNSCKIYVDGDWNKAPQNFDCSWTLYDYSEKSWAIIFQQEYHSYFENMLCGDTIRGLKCNRLYPLGEGNTFKGYIIGKRNRNMRQIGEAIGFDGDNLTSNLSQNVPIRNPTSTPQIGAGPVIMTANPTENVYGMITKIISTVKGSSILSSHSVTNGDIITWTYTGPSALVTEAITGKEIVEVLFNATIGDETILSFTMKV